MTFALFRRRLPAVAVLFVGLLLLARLGIWESERLWFRAEGYSAVFSSLMAWRGGAFVVASGIFGLCLTFTARTAWRIAEQSHAPVGLGPDGGLRQRLIPLEDKLGLDRYRRRATWIYVICISWATGLSAATRYDLWVRAWYGAPIGKSDELWHRDLSFYLWTLPAAEAISLFINALLWTALALAAAIYIYEEALETGGKTLSAARGATRHMGLLVALLLAWKGTSYRLAIWDLQSAGTGFGREGMNFLGSADLTHTVPLLRTLATACPLAALAVAVLYLRRKGRVATAIALGFASSAWLVSMVIPLWANGLELSGDQRTQQEYLRNWHLRATRTSWGLQNVVQVTPAADGASGREAGGVGIAEAATPAANGLQLAIWPSELVKTELDKRLESDKSPLRVTNLQQETWLVRGRERPIYLAVCQRDADATRPEGDDKGAIFIVDAGRTGPDGGLVVYAAPDSPVTLPLAPAAAPGAVLTSTALDLNFGQWVTAPPRDTVPLEGVASPALPQQPDRMDIPLRTGLDWRLATPANGADRATHAPDRAPTPGVSTQTAWNRVLLALRFFNPGLLRRQGSSVYWHLRIADRCRQLAPFVDWGHAEPRLLTGKGHPMWVLYGFVWSRRYPGAAAPPGYPGNNYVRAALLATVDGTTGATRFYALDRQEPFTRLYLRAFPGVFAPVASLPASLRTRCGASATLFAAQSLIWSRYHPETAEERRTRLARAGAAETPPWLLALQPAVSYSSFESAQAALRRLPLAGPAPQALNRLVAAYSGPRNAWDQDNPPLPLTAMLAAVDSPGPLPVRLVCWQPAKEIPVDALWALEPPTRLVAGRPVPPPPSFITFVPGASGLSVVRAIKAPDHRAGSIPARLQLEVARFDLAGRRDMPPSRSAPGQRSAVEAGAQLNAARGSFERLQAARQSGDWAAFGRQLDQLGAQLKSAP